MFLLGLATTTKSAWFLCYNSRYSTIIIHIQQYILITQWLISVVSSGNQNRQTSCSQTRIWPGFDVKLACNWSATPIQTYPSASSSSVSSAQSVRRLPVAARFTQTFPNSQHTAGHILANSQRPQDRRSCRLSGVHNRIIQFALTMDTSIHPHIVDICLQST